ncbi:MFS transporter [Massilia putida]|uniref:MFS transporter n=1 Tax=Massilia putida TaxID=1141883 RepID=UPI001E561439|nr:MFS transporter [Massilia putida]
MTLGALPAILKAYPRNPAVQWVITSHFLVYAGGAAVCGRLGDLYGLKRVMLCVLGIALCGSLLSATTSGLAFMIVGRGMQGLAGALVPLSYGVVRRSLPQARIPLAVSIVAVSATVTSSVGLLVGGVVVDHFHWRAIFWVSATLAVLALAACASWVPAVPGQRGAGKLDLVGGVLLVPGISMLMYAVMRAKATGWSDHGTLALLGAGALVLAVWLRYELRHENPMIDLRLLKRRQVALGNAAMALLCLGALQYPQVMSILLQQPAGSGQGFGLSATAAGMLQLPVMVLYLVGGPWSGYLSTRHGPRVATVAGAALLCVGWSALLLEHRNLVFLVGMDYVQALGLAVLFAAIPNLIVEDVPADRVSEATGVLSVVRSVSLAVGSQLVGFVMAGTTIAFPAGGAVRYPAPGAYVGAFGTIAGLCLLLLLVGITLPRRARAGRSGGVPAAAQRPRA